MNDDHFEISFPDETTMKISCTKLSAAWVLHHLLENYAGTRWVMPAETGRSLAFSGRSGWEVPIRTIKDLAAFKFQRQAYPYPGGWQLENGTKIGIEYSGSRFKSLTGQSGTGILYCSRIFPSGL